MLWGWVRSSKWQLVKANRQIRSSNLGFQGVYFWCIFSSFTLYIPSSSFVTVFRKRAASLRPKELSSAQFCLNFVYGILAGGPVEKVWNPKGGTLAPWPLSRSLRRSCCKPERLSKHDQNRTKKNKQKNSSISCFLLVEQVFGTLWNPNPFTERHQPSKKAPKT